MAECPHCGNKTKSKPKIKPVSYSPLAFSEEIKIENAEHYTCRKCSKPWVELGDMREIELEIASILHDMPELTRAHAFFIRQHLLKISVFELAIIFKVPPIYIIDVEKYKRPMSQELLESYKSLLTEFMIDRKVLVENGENEITLKLY